MVKNKTTTTSLRKSLSYNDLANEMAILFSKPANSNNKLSNKKIDHQPLGSNKICPNIVKSNPRKNSGGRRMSKTFRRTPTIVIHPPEDNLERITNSCPNIHALIFRENCGIATCHPNFNSDYASGTKDEMNHSCPDINVLLQSPDKTKTNPFDQHVNNKNSVNKWSKSCSAIDQIGDGSTYSKFNTNNLQFSDLSDSCPNINEQFNNPNSIETLSHNYDNIPLHSDISNNYKYNYPSVYDATTSYQYQPTQYETKKPLERVVSFTECLNELDALKNEVNDIKNECECLLAQCPCHGVNSTNFGAQKRSAEYKTVYKSLPNRPDRKKSLIIGNTASNKQELFLRGNSEPNLFKTVFAHHNKSFVSHNTFSDFGISSKNKLYFEPHPPPKKCIIKSPKKHDVTPTDLLRFKIKQSLSMFDLNLPSKTDAKYDNYATIHGGMKFPNELTNFTLRNYKSNYKKDCAATEKPSTSISLSDTLDGENNMLAIVKCCCGLSNCQNGRLQVVPITFQQLLDSNSNYEMVRRRHSWLWRRVSIVNVSA